MFRLYAWECLKCLLLLCRPGPYQPWIGRTNKWIGGTNKWYFPPHFSATRVYVLNFACHSATTGKLLQVGLHTVPVRFLTPELKGGDDAFLEVKSKTKLRAQTMAEAVSGKRLGRRNAILPSLNTMKKGAMAVGKGAIKMAKKNSADQIEGAHAHPQASG